MKRKLNIGDLVQPIATSGAVVVDFMPPSLKIPLNMRCVQAREAVRVIVARNHVDDMLRDVDIFSHTGEHSPLVLIHPVPTQTTGIVRVNQVPELVIAETKVCIQESSCLELLEEVYHRLAGAMLAI